MRQPPGHRALGPETSGSSPLDFEPWQVGELLLCEVIGCTSAHNSAGAHPATRTMWLFSGFSLPNVAFVVAGASEVLAFTSVGFSVSLIQRGVCNNTSSLETMEF